MNTLLIVMVLTAVTNVETRLVYVGRFPYPVVFELSFDVTNDSDWEHYSVKLAGRDRLERVYISFIRGVTVKPGTTKHFTFRYFSHLDYYLRVRMWREEKSAMDTGRDGLSPFYGR